MTNKHFLKKGKQLSARLQKIILASFTAGTLLVAVALNVIFLYPPEPFSMENGYVSSTDWEFEMGGFFGSSNSIFIYWTTMFFTVLPCIFLPIGIAASKKVPILISMILFSLSIIGAILLLDLTSGLQEVFFSHGLPALGFLKLCSDIVGERKVENGVES
jgi:hypothetical protein